MKALPAPHTLVPGWGWEAGVQLRSGAAVVHWVHLGATVLGTFTVHRREQVHKQTQMCVWGGGGGHW